MSTMTLAYRFGLAVCCLLAQSLLANETPLERLTGAVEALSQRVSYSWTTEIEVPEETRFRPGRTTGISMRSGVIHVTMSFGRRLTHVVIEGEKAAVTDRDGRWETVSLLDQGYRSQGYAASIARNVQTPAAEAEEWASQVTTLQAVDGTLVADLPAEAVRARLAGRRRSDAVRDPRGTVRFWINNGLLAKYVLRLEGTLVDDDRARKAWQQITVVIHDVGKAKLELPPGAGEALSRPVPKPEPRLSDADAENLLKMRGKRQVGVHDPSSIVKCDDKYWLFSTGTGVSSWFSDDLSSWQRGPRVFSEMPQWVTDVVPDQRGHFWAPDVIHLNDRYLLYYSVSTFGKNTSAIALASTPTLDPDDPAYQWTDEGIVIQSRSGDDFNAIDPAVILTEEGDLWMSFGSFWSGIKLIELDPHTGKRLAGKDQVASIASYREIEAPHIYQRAGWFYLFINWGKCCRGVDSTYNIRVGRSRQITGPYVDKRGVDLATGGGSLLLQSDGPFIGPGHPSLFRKGDRYLLSCHYYDGTEGGRSMLSLQPLRWTEEGWPVVAQRADASLEDKQN